MKSEFNTSWKASVQPRKQHKFRANAPLHVKHKFLSAHLSKPLSEKYGKRSLPLRKGDEVLVMRGSFRKKQAKVSSVNHSFCRVFIEGIQRTKKDGTKVNVPFNARTLLIVSLNQDDKKRFSSTSKPAQTEAKTEKKEIKTNKTSGVKNASN